MSGEKLDLLKGTLDLLVLQILSSMGPSTDMASHAAWNRSATMSSR